MQATKGDLRKVTVRILAKISHLTILDCRIVGISQCRKNQLVMFRGANKNIVDGELDNKMHDVERI